MRIVITGSSSGIGRALAERLLAHGHEVWGLARRDQSDLAGRQPGRFHATHCDVADWARVSAAEREIGAVWPAIDGLVTCAGLQGAIGRATAVDPREWSATVRTNLEGTYYAIRAFHAALRRSARRSKVVCFSGGGASKARPNFSAYAAAKTAIVRLVETIAEEDRDAPFDINTVAPGAINTRMTDGIIAAGPAVAGQSEYASALKQKQTGDAPMEKAIDLVEWLLSPASDGVSGRLISAVWDPWMEFAGPAAVLRDREIYTLRRVTPKKPD